MSTIAIDPDVKEKLDNLKIMKNESYNSVVKRLVEKDQEYKPMFPKEEISEKEEHNIKDIDAWIDKKLIEDKEILDALGRK
jgi:predicted CopG family antitoxin